MNSLKNHYRLNLNLEKLKIADSSIFDKTMTLVLAIAVLIVISPNCLAQDNISDQKLIYKTGNPADWPAELDAVIAAPDNHKIVLENDHVRVLEVSVAPGEVEPLHSHRWPSTLYVQNAGDFIDKDGEGNIIFDSRKLIEPLALPYTMYKEPEAPHSVTNLSKMETIRLIRIEIKTKDTQQNIEIIDGLYKAFAIGDMPTILGLMDENITWNEAESNTLADGNPYIGPEAVLNGVFARVGEMYESFSLDNIKMHEMSNNQVLATLYYILHTKNGKIYEVQAAHHWTLNNEGKIVEFQQYVDTKKLADSEEN